MVWLVLICGALASVHCISASYMQQSFYFDYAISSDPVTIPVTTQCETISLTWDRSTADGPSPSAPYYLQIYTSAYVFPFVVEAGSSLSFDWQVPFGPGTLYQICMFDKNGYTGGCQATYAVVANSSVTDPSCSTLSFPLGPLEIDAQVENGPLSQFGWVNSCSDISITPKNGTPPYTLTVAPALHPPYNQTFNSMKTVNWTVDLSWASPFFISVVDSEFNFWSYGPLHSGNGETHCLSESSIDDSKLSSSGILVGLTATGVLVGMLAGIAGAVCFMKRRQRRERKDGHFVSLGSTYDSSDPFTPRVDPYDTPLSLTTSGGTRYRPVPTMPSDPSFNMGTRHSSHYHVEPFVMPGEEQPVQGPMSPGSAAQSSRQQSGHVYVVHHDGGRAPVTVYHEDGTEVVELPPRYNEDTPPSHAHPSSGTSEGQSSSGRRSSSELRSDLERPTSFLHQPRRPSGAPKKLGRP